MSGSAFAVTHHAFSSGAGRTSDGNGSHASTLKSPSYTKSVSWQHYQKQVYLAGMVLWAVGDILNYFWGSNSFTFVMFSCVAFFGTAFVNSLNWALVPDTVDYGEWKTGIRAEGSVYTGYTFFRKISAALAGFLPGIMLTQIGYVPNIAQSDATLQGLRQLIFIWPCALAIIAALTMGFFYTLNEKRFALIIEEINQRKNKEIETEEKTASVTL